MYFVNAEAKAQAFTIHAVKMEVRAVNVKIFTAVVSVHKFAVNVNAIAFVTTRYNLAYANVCAIVEGINIITGQAFATTYCVAQFVLQVACAQASFGVYIFLYFYSYLSFKMYLLHKSHIMFNHDAN